MPSTVVTAPPETTAPASSRFDRQRVTHWLSVNGVYVALLLVLLVDGLFLDRFLSVNNLRTQLVQVVPVLIVALGMALVIGTEGIDLSVGAVMALAAAILPLYLGYGWPVAVLMAMLVGALAGVLNGTLVAVVGVQPIVATLALLVGGRGLALVLADGQAKQILDPGLIGFGSDRVLGIPKTVILAVLLVLLVGFVVRRTTFGRQLLAVGGNPRASRLAGLPVRRTLIRRLRDQRGARRDRRRGDHGTAELQRPVQRRHAGRAVGHHRGRRRRDPALRWPGAHPRHGGRRAAHAAAGSHAQPVRRAGLDDAHHPGVRHPGGRRAPALGRTT
jgi:hypothetical protein